MPYPASSYPEGVDLTIIAGNQLHQVINGEANEVVSTTSGDIPSVRKALADSMMFKVPVEWVQGEVTTDPLETRLYNGQPYWAPEATLANPITLGVSPVATTDWLLAPQGYRNDYNLGKYQAGILISDSLEYVVYNGESYFATNPPYTTTATTPDNDTGNLFVGGYLTIKSSAEVFSNTNLLSNHNFLTPSPDAITHPNATPESYVAGTQIFSGVYAGDSGCTITLIDGRVNCKVGDYKFKLPDTGGIERIPVFTSSVSDYDGIPKTTGVSHALVGDEYVVTVIPAAGDVFSVKLEQGGAATRHEVQSAKGQIYTVNNIAEAKACGAQVGSKIHWLGYYRVSDGGSGWGIVKSGSHVDDGGLIISINANTYIEQNLCGSSSNPMKWGARRQQDQAGFDSTVAFKKAIAYSMPDRKTFKIPIGSWKITEPLSFIDPVTGSSNGGIIKGYGHHSVLEYFPTDGAEAENLPKTLDGYGDLDAGCINVGYDTYKGMLIKDFQVRLGTGATMYKSCGIKAYRWYQSDMRRVEVNGLYAGVHISFGWTNKLYSMMTYNCTFGIVWDNITIGTVEKHDAYGCRIGLYAGWNLYGSNVAETGGYGQGVTLRENTYQSCFEAAVVLKNVQNVTFEGWYTEGNCLGAFTVLHEIFGNSDFDQCEFIITSDNQWGNSNITFKNNWLSQHRQASEVMLGAKNVYGLTFESINNYTVPFFQGQKALRCVFYGLISRIKSDTAIRYTGNGTVTTDEDFSGAFSSSLPYSDLSNLTVDQQVTLDAGQSKTLLVPFSSPSCISYKSLAITCNNPGANISFKSALYERHVSETVLKVIEPLVISTAYNSGNSQLEINLDGGVVSRNGGFYIAISATNNAGVQQIFTYKGIPFSQQRRELYTPIVDGALPDSLVPAQVGIFGAPAHVSLY